MYVCQVIDKVSVFSAHAEMFLHWWLQGSRVWCFLCTCRDVSGFVLVKPFFNEFSLHMQRCFYRQALKDRAEAVFSAHAEMFLERVTDVPLAERFLCTCRDVSKVCILSIRTYLFSLHMQRCFPMARMETSSDIVFSAHAEMFLVAQFYMCECTGFLCTCRDVSLFLSSFFSLGTFSLHMQRCFSD